MPRSRRRRASTPRTRVAPDPRSSRTDGERRYLRRVRATARRLAPVAEGFDDWAARHRYPPLGQVQFWLPVLLTIQCPDHTDVRDWDPERARFVVSVVDLEGRSKDAMKALLALRLLGLFLLETETHVGSRADLWESLLVLADDDPRSPC